MTPVIMVMPSVEDSAVELAGQARGERPFSLVNGVGGAGLIVLVVPNVHLDRLRVVVAVLLEVPSSSR
jgi:hypothetical protein